MVSACVISIRAINRLVILSGFWTHQNKDGLHQWTPPPYAHPTAPFSVMPIHSGLNSLLCLLCLNHEMKDLGQFSHESGYTDLTGPVSCPGYASFVDKHETGIMVQFGWFVSELIVFAVRKFRWQGDAVLSKVSIFRYISILNIWNSFNTRFPQYWYVLRCVFQSDVWQYSFTWAVHDLVFSASEFTVNVANSKCLVFTHLL